MIKDHPVIAALSIAGAVGLGAITLSTHYNVEPLRDRINAQQALLEEQKAEISRLRDQLSDRQQQIPPRSDPPATPHYRNPDVEAPGSPEPPAANADRVSLQSYEGFSVELVDADAVGTSVTFTFNITNTNPQDKKLMIAGSDGGNMRFLGFYSSLLAGGHQYVAERTSIAGDRNYMVIPGGQAVRATVRFDGMPPDIHTVDHLTLRVTTGGTYPSHRLPFGPVELSR